MNPYDFLGLPTPRHRLQRQQAPPPEPVTEEEASGMGTQLVGGIMGGLGYVGETLDKPAAALRGVLAGQPEQLANLIPFSDTMGITDPTQRVSGRDLLETWGALDPNQPGLDWGDVGGFAAEVALDPLWTVSGPLGTVAKGGKYLRTTAKGKKLADTAAAAAHVEEAATKGFGKAAEYLGYGYRNPATFAEQVRQGERGLLGIKNPFTGEQLLSTASLGKTANAATANVLEKMFYGGGPIANAASAPLRAARSLFSPFVDYHLTGQAQKARDVAMAEYAIQNAAAKNVRPILAEQHKRLTGMMDEIAQYHGGLGDNEGFDQFSRMAAEYKPLEYADATKQAAFGPDIVRNMLGDYLGAPAKALTPGQQRIADDFVQGTVEYVSSLKSMKDKLYQEAIKLGLPTNGLDDMFTSHFFRRPDKSGMMRAWKKREDVYRHVPGGSGTINAMAGNQLLKSSRFMSVEELRKTLQAQGSTSSLAAMTKKQLRAEYDALTKGQLETLLGKQGQKMSLAQLQDELAWRDHLKPALDETWGPNKNLKVKYGGKEVDYGEVVAEWTNPSKIRKTSPGGQVVEKEVLKKIRKLRRRLAATKEPLFSHSLLQDFADGVEGYMRAVSTMRSAHHLLSYPKLVKLVDDADTAFRADPAKIPLQKLWHSLGWTDTGLEKVAANLKQAADPDTLARMAVDGPTANRLKAFAILNEPRTYSELGKMYDRMNALYRGGLTSYFPGFHVRNLLSGDFQTLSDGSLPGFKGIKEFMKGKLAAYQYLRGKGTQDLKHLDSFLAGDLMGDQLGQMLESGLPNKFPKPLYEGFVEPIKGAFTGKESWDIRQAPGVMVHFSDAAKLAADKQPKMWWGAKLAQNAYASVEFMNRYSQYHALMESGYTPAQAAFHVKRTHFDYSQLSKFEQSYMRRFGPLFYCVDEQTECLTRNGWVTHDQLSIGEEILTYNMGSKELQWNSVRDIFCEDYNGQLLHFEGKTIDILCTVDHRFVTVKGLREAKDIGFNANIPLNGNYEQHEDYPISDQVLACIGWIATDGHCQHRGKAECLYSIYQKKQPFLHEIKILLGNDYNENLHPDSNVSQLSIRHPLKGEIKKHYKTKRDLLELISKLSYRQLMILRKVMFDAEGSVGHEDTTREFKQFGQEGKEIRDAYQIILLLTGNNSRASDKGIYISSKPLAKCFRPKVVWHKGKVWCPNTANATWIMRRNGKIIPTGNTWLRKSIPYTVSKLAESPGGATGQTIRGMYNAMQANEAEGGSYTPNFMRERVAFPWGAKNPETGEQTFISSSGLPVEDLNLFAFRGGKPDVVRTGKKALAQLPPLLSQPIERLFDEQLYTGRKLSDLKNRQLPFIGEAPDLLSGLAQIGPWSRLFGEYEKVTDPRKSYVERALNLATGVKYSTYDTDRWKVLDAIDNYRKALDASGQTKTFSRPYLPEMNRAAATPDVLNMLERYAELERLKKQRMDQEKAKKGK